MTTDLFTPDMPLELAAELDQANRALRDIAEDIYGWLGEFFDEAWIECHTERQAQTFDMVKTKDAEGKPAYVKGEPYTVTFMGTPDFNAFDRAIRKYELAASKLRWQLWDIHKAARGGAEAGGLGVLNGPTSAPTSASHAGVSSQTTTGGE